MVLYIEQVILSLVLAADLIQAPRTGTFYNFCSTLFITTYNVSNCYSVVSFFGATGCKLYIVYSTPIAFLTSNFRIQWMLVTLHLFG